MEFKFGELFCGPGGLSLGALRSEVYSDIGERFFLSHSFAFDADKDSCETYIKNICGGDSSNVFHISIEEFSRNIGMHVLPEVDALAFGFPCNDYSIVGEKKGINGSYGGLYKYGKMALDIKCPKWFIAENVKGLGSADNKCALKIILEALSSSGSHGYNITAHLYKFEQYGIPQTRHRIIIVGIDNSLNLKFKVPAPTFLEKYKSVREVLEACPIPGDAPNQELTKNSTRVVERLKFTPQGENAWFLDRMFEMSDLELKSVIQNKLPFLSDGEKKKYLDVDCARSHIEKVKLNVKSVRMSQIYKRLVPDEPSYTITGSGGGGTHVYHWEENRALTNRERARIQTFPDYFKFCGKKESVRKQIGMAVPPDAAEIIVTAVLKTFAGIEYEWVVSHW